ncbi:hypothetical protein YB2330_000658 [Saitoella coloradoensis]
MAFTVRRSSPHDVTALRDIVPGHFCNYEPMSRSFDPQPSPEDIAPLIDSIIEECVPSGPSVKIMSLVAVDDNGDIAAFLLARDLRNEHAPETIPDNAFNKRLLTAFDKMHNQAEEAKPGLHSEPWLFVELCGVLPRATGQGIFRKLCDGMKDFYAGEGWKGLCGITAAPGVQKVLPEDSLFLKKMSSKSNVAVIGGLGNLGKEIALASIERGHSVRVLTRSATVSDAAAVEALKKAGAEIVKVDYDTEESILKAFNGIDTVVTLAPAFTPDAIDGQKRLIQLAIKAGVKRWVPNEFGTAPTSSLTQSPIFGLRTSLRQYLIEHQSLISHTFFYCGYFTEYITHRSGFGINLDAKTADLEGEGTAPVSWTSRKDVGKFVASALGRDESKNAEVRICGDVKSLGEVVKLFERELETNFAVTKHTLEESETRHAEKKCSIFALIIAKGGAYVGRGGKYVEPAEHDLRGDLNLDNHVYQDWETWKVEAGVKDFVSKKKEGQEVNVSMEGGR